MNGSGLTVVGGDDDGAVYHVVCGMLGCNE